jgi:hypothetical protein
LNSLKTVFARLGRAKTGDATAEEVSAAEKAYGQIGIQLRDSITNEFRDIPDVLDELSAKWGNLNSVQRSYITEVKLLAV